jgi:hypothetical protein
MTAEEIAARLRQAETALELADVPDDLREQAYDRALDAVGLGPSQVSGMASSVSTLGGSPASAPAGDPIGALSVKLNLLRETVEQVFEPDEDHGLRLILKRSMLPRPDQKAAAMRDVALLISVGRQGAGLEEYTSFATIRRECEDLAVLDSSNFATEVGRLEMRRRGGRSAPELKANRHHYEDAGKLIGVIAGSGASR